jgi:hypothetical protein
MAITNEAPAEEFTEHAQGVPGPAINIERQRSLIAHLQEVAARARVHVAGLRADLFLMSGLMSTPDLQATSLEIDGRAIAEELNGLADIAVSIHFDSLRPAGYERYLGRKCELCDGKVRDVEKGRGEQVVLICTNDHRALLVEE